MNLYSNSFSYAFNLGRNEFVLNFMQDYPRFDEKGDIVDTTRETVSPIVMPIEVAKELAEAIMDSLPKEEE